MIAAIVSGTLIMTGCAPRGAAAPQPAPNAKAGTSQPAEGDALQESDAPDEGDAPEEGAAEGGSPSATASDGDNLKACADGRCEVRAGAGAKLPVPRKMGVASIRVRSVEPDTVTIVGRYIGNSSSGTCDGSMCESSSSNGEFKVSMGPDSTATQNGLSITVVTVEDGHAVLRLAPA
ncbi:hypothetical protein [Nonomuraea phyllanthi]|uniref:hypothetical protein n=1 Tax=Nonomuraea phyllanthi TaxID=2219224 RepID=UPI0011184759|nr:hypothetical protein [Nonomuraea phyllanthi]